MGPEASSLLGRFEVLPTQSRQLQGLRDVMWLVLITVPFLVLRGMRYVMGWLGITEHRQVVIRGDSSHA